MRFDRLLSMILMLRAHGHLTAPELARALDVSQRTIYRDLDALSAAGIPIYTQPGAGGGIYMDEEYRISLAGVTAPELQALLMVDDIKPLRDLGMSGAAEGIMLKLLAALPAMQREAVQQARERIYVDPLGWWRHDAPVPHLAELQEAVLHDRRARITYRRPDGSLREREIAPYGLVSSGGDWYLVAQREGQLRTYKVLRIQALEVLEERFTRDRAFRLADYWRESSAAFMHGVTEQFTHIEATARVSTAGLQFLERMVHADYQIVEGPDEAGFRVLRLWFGDYRLAPIWLAGLVSEVEVLGPPELIAQVREVARSVIARYGE